MIIEFTIYGEPVGKGRPRFARRGNFVQTYTPEKTRQYEKKVRDAYREKYDVAFSPEASLAVHITAYFGVPKSASKAKRKEMLDGYKRPTKKPDADNCSKIILDSLNGVCWSDDTQVVTLHMEKWYGEEPRVEVFITDGRDD